MQKLSEWSKTNCCLWNIEWYQEEEEKKTPILEKYQK